MKERIAIVGSGVSGSVAAYYLSQKHAVTVFEKEDYFGGHVHTHRVKDKIGKNVRLDTGFVFFNKPNYPKFLSLLDELKIPYKPSKVSFGIGQKKTVSGNSWWQAVEKQLFEKKDFQKHRRGYHEVGLNRAPVEAYVKRLEAADALILSFPVWNFGYPAMLKGFFDRVFLPGVSFRLENGKVVPNMTHIRKIAAVTTYGGTRLRAFMAGDPPRKLVKRHLWHVTRPASLKYLALYDMNRVTESGLSSHLAYVRKELETL